MVHVYQSSVYVPAVPNWYCTGTIWYYEYTYTFKPTVPFGIAIHVYVPRYVHVYVLEYHGTLAGVWYLEVQGLYELSTKLAMP